MNKTRSLLFCLAAFPLWAGEGEFTPPQFEAGSLIGSGTDASGDPLILDYSYAGYRFGEEPIPDIEGPVFDVTDFGAVANDGTDDTEAIQRAIDAATEAGGGVVFFPRGVFHLGTALDPDEKRGLTVESSHIVLRGSGATRGGTVLFFVNEWTGRDFIRIQASDTGIGATRARIVERVPRGGREIAVDDASALSPGQWIAIVAGNPLGVVDHFMGSRTPKEEWTRILERGVPLRELHQVGSIDGNRVTLRAPVAIALLEEFDPRIRAFEAVSEIGIEDIAFLGNWLGHFVHHRSPFDDYAFNAIGFNNVVDSWIRRCMFLNFNQTVRTDHVANMTIEQTRLAGAGPHSDHRQSRSSRVLQALTSDESDGAWHNLQWRAQTAGAVFWRVEMHPMMPIDIHGMYAYSTLLDAVEGGYLMDSGGPVASFPQHGPGLVLWNFNYLREGTRGSSDRARSIDFWSTRPWVVDPVVAGLYGAAEEVGVNPDSMLVLESLGRPVEPESLYEAQLAARLGGLPGWAAASLESWEDFRLKPLPEFFHPLADENRLLHNHPQDIPMDFLGDRVNGIKQMRRHPNAFDVEMRANGGFRTDFMKTVTAIHNILSCVHSFGVPFGEWQLYADPEETGTGTARIDISENEGKRSLVVLVEFPVAKPPGYFERFPPEKHVFRKYLGDNKAQEWKAAHALVHALGGSIDLSTHEGGSRVRMEIPEMADESQPSASERPSAR